jgi:CBS-domain-containing membrane protein
MSTITNAANARRRRRMITYSWILALAILTISLIYWEKTALLYILATLGVTALLVIVARADLAGPETVSKGPSDAASASDIGGGVTSTFGSNPPR